MDLLLRRRMMMSASGGGGGGGAILPSEYQQVEYLLGDGGPYIDTNVALSSLVKLKIVTKFQMVSQFDIDWFGTLNEKGYVTWNVANHERLTFIRWFSNSALSLNYYSGHSVSDLMFNDAMHTLNVGGEDASNPNPIYVDGVQVATISPPASPLTPTNNTIRVFRGRDFTGSSKFAFFQIYSDGSLVRNMYACYRKSDNKPGMYDLVTGAFFTNANTSGNDFTIGPDIV